MTSTALKMGSAQQFPLQLNRRLIVFFVFSQDQ